MPLVRGGQGREPQDLIDDCGCWWGLVGIVLAILAGLYLSTI